MSLSQGDIPNRRNVALQTQTKTRFLWGPDLAVRYNRTLRTITRWKKSGKLPPSIRMPNGREAWTDTVIEQHERNLVGGDEAA
jgi:hypothetical protein